MGIDMDLIVANMDSLNIDAVFFILLETTEAINFYRKFGIFLKVKELFT